MMKLPKIKNARIDKIKRKDHINAQRYIDLYELLVSTGQQDAFDEANSEVAYIWFQLGERGVLRLEEYFKSRK